MSRPLSPDLTVITFTNGKRAALLERCRSSVSAALPPGAEHLVINVSRQEFDQQRLDALFVNRYTAFVDDDDEIHPDALSLCLAALKQAEVGVAVTNEVSVFSDTKWYQRSRKFYQNVYTNPTEVHHLVMYDSSKIPVQQIRTISSEFIVGVDWFTVAGTVLSAGAVHVPLDGYLWYRSTLGSLTSTDTATYNAQIAQMRIAIAKTWPGKTGMIPLSCNGTCIVTD
jgi:hypothetical protein